MHVDPVTLAERLVTDARAQARRMLLEPEGFQILDALGLRVPRRLFIRCSDELDHLPIGLLGDQVVVKVVAAAIPHKSDVGGVVVVPNDRETVRVAVRTMERTFAGQDVSGYSLAEFVPYDVAAGGEWLLGLRWTDEFGPVVTVGVGGVAAEFLSSTLKAGAEAAVFSARRGSRETLETGVRRLAVTALATGQVRRQPARTTVAAICDAIERFSKLAPAFGPGSLTEFEINPLVASADQLVALDVLGVVGNRDRTPGLPRPLTKLRNLLVPKTIAVMGVSAGMNPGRVILKNLLNQGFDPRSVFVVKPGVQEIDGCRAVPGIAALPTAVDLLILSVSAAQIPEALVEAIEARKAESLIVIPGGLEEKSGADSAVDQMRDALVLSRTTEWGGPVVNGGNCLGIQSQPGRYNTMFIPGYKLGLTPGPSSPLAVISQSGAFAVSRATRLPGIRPRYSITVGNQMDLTIGDYLTFLQGDPQLKVFAVYLEGFKPDDGDAALDAVQRITADGRTVILYRAGRTPQGQRATASHTAAVAGDYAVTRDLFRAAGAIVADSLDDFTELVMLFTLLDGRSVNGRGIGALSNAGYECVAIADHLGALELPAFIPPTMARFQALLDAHRLSSIVDVHNPFDVTPMANDEMFEAAVSILLHDPRVDVGVIGCVPATPALNTLPRSIAHGEDLTRTDALASRLVRIASEQAKPVIAIVDAGPMYEPLAQRLLDGGIPTFRAADRAMRLLNVYVEDRFGHTVRAQVERWVDEFSLPAV